VVFNQNTFTQKYNLNEIKYLWWWHVDVVFDDKILRIRFLYCRFVALFPFNFTNTYRSRIQPNANLLYFSSRLCWPTALKTLASQANKAISQYTVKFINHQCNGLPVQLLFNNNIIKLRFWDTLLEMKLKWFTEIL